MKDINKNIVFIGTLSVLLVLPSLAAAEIVIVPRLIVESGGIPTVPIKSPSLITVSREAANISVFTAPLLDCQACHNDVYAKWAASAHANSQSDVADELATNRAGQTPYDVIQGADAENCIACHSPTAVLASKGMNETQALEYFFTTSNGTFTANTTAANTADWPNVACTACHNVPSDHPATMPTLALFNSQTGSYVAVGSSKLCGECHGNLHFADTDHLIYNAWNTSKHANTQGDVADELAANRAGQTPYDVIQGNDAENCIACHAPTAVLANKGMNETQALKYFFTTSNGTFTTNTTSDYSADWPSVACTACHDQHNPKPSYFNSSTGRYEPINSTDELCGQCHGNLRFSGTDHLSYNVMQGTGGIGVPDEKTMPGTNCTSCHMFVSNVDGSNSTKFKGHSFAITVQELGGNSTTSCTACHSSMDTAASNSVITGWKSEFQTLDAAAQKNVTAATTAMEGVHDNVSQAKLEEAQHNLGYAESDESSGFHNHKYLVVLLKDANNKALQILFPPATQAAKTVGVNDNNGTWALENASSPGGAEIIGFGFSNTIPVAGDWNGDNRTEIGVYNKGGNNFLLRYPNGSFTVIGLGWANVTPVVGDWNGDSKDEVGVYDSSKGTWAIENASSPIGADIVGFGFFNTIPVVGDWNGDGKIKIGVYNKAGNNFLLRNSDGTYIVIGLGWPGVIPVVGDWNGDGKDEVGVYDGNTGTWALQNASAPSGADIVGFGFFNTIPVVGDWNGDGRDEIGVYNKAANNFLLRNPDGTVIVIGLGWSGVSPVVGKWS